MTPRNAAGNQVLGFTADGLQFGRGYDATECHQVVAEYHPGQVASIRPRL